jgi:hypothetical protein
VQEVEADGGDVNGGGRAAGAAANSDVEPNNDTTGSHGLASNDISLQVQLISFVTFVADEVCFDVGTVISLVSLRSSQVPKNVTVDM